jgi:hypothetical protein
VRRVSSILILAIIVSIPTAAIAVRAIALTVLNILDPTVRWEPSASTSGSFSGTVSVGLNQTVRVIGESKLRAITVSALIPGGVFLSTLLAIIGVARAHRWLIFVAAVLMLAETPLTFSIAPLTLITGLLYLYFAIRATRAVQA